MRATPRPSSRQGAKAGPQATGFPVVIGEGSHPFPFRTRKLSPLPPMVLHAKVCGRVGHCREYFSSPPFGGLSFVRSTLLCQKHPPEPAPRRASACTDAFDAAHIATDGSRDHLARRSAAIRGRDRLSSTVVQVGLGAEGGAICSDRSRRHPCTFSDPGDGRR